MTANPGRLHAAQQCEPERWPRSGHDSDPIVWVFFGLDHKTAIRYADNARQLLVMATEKQDPADT